MVLFSQLPCFLKLCMSFYVSWNASCKKGETRVGKGETWAPEKYNCYKRKQHWTTYIARHRTVLLYGPRILNGGHCRCPPARGHQEHSCGGQAGLLIFAARENTQGPTECLRKSVRKTLSGRLGSGWLIWEKSKEAGPTSRFNAVRNLQGMGNGGGDSVIGYFVGNTVTLFLSVIR